LRFGDETHGAETRDDERDESCDEPLGVVLCISKAPQSIEWAPRLLEKYNPLETQMVYSLVH